MYLLLYYKFAARNILNCQKAAIDNLIGARAILKGKLGRMHKKLI